MTRLIPCRLSPVACRLPPAACRLPPAACRLRLLLPVYNKGITVLV